MLFLVQTMKLKYGTKTYHPKVPLRFIKITVDYTEHLILKKRTLKPKGKCVCNNFIHSSSVSCLKIFLNLSVALESKIISSTGCNIILSGDHEFPARAKCL